MEIEFRDIELRVSKRFENWDHFVRCTPEYSIGLEVVDDTPGHRGHHIHFDHHSGVVREATMSAAMQAYMAVRQGRLMERWLQRQRPVPVYVWNADQDVCLAAFVLEHHRLLERSEGTPLLRWIVQYNNKIDVCGGLYPVSLDELVQNHFTWVFEPYRQQRMRGKTQGDEALVRETISNVCGRLCALLDGKAGTAAVTAKPDILFRSNDGFVIADEKGDPNSRLVLAAQGHTNLISLITKRSNGRYTYSIIRGSPFDEDTFPVAKLIEAFQAAEDLPNVKIWGGSNLAAGSDSELGSSLDWQRLRDIADPIVREASLASKSGPGRPEPYKPPPPVLLVMPPENRDPLRQSLAECGVEAFLVTSCGEARRVLDLEYNVNAIFTARHLPDGTYRDVIRIAATHSHALPIVVCQRDDDGDVADLFEADTVRVLTEPYDRNHVMAMLDTLQKHNGIQ